MIEEINDINLIISIWRPYTKELGIPYKDYIQDCIDNKSFFCYKVDNEIAGIASYWIYNKKREIAVESLITLPAFRGQVIASKLIKHIYKENESLIKTLGYKFVTEAQEGLPNNKVYEHLSIDEVHYTSRSGKTKLVKYFLDTSHFD